VVYKSDKEFSLSSAVKYGVDVADDLGAGNLEDMGGRLELSQRGK
jgi:hypothetical protein